MNSRHTTTAAALLALSAPLFAQQTSPMRFVPEGSELVLRAKGPAAWKKLFEATQLTKMLAARDKELTQLRGELRDEARKVRELRQELQVRATETIREHVRAEEATSELEVARAGSDEVRSELSRLQEERKSLTSTMRQLEDTLRGEDRSPAEADAT